MVNKIQLENIVSSELENRTFEELLEDFDLTPEEVFCFLYQSGLIDDEILERYDAYI